MICIWCMKTFPIFKFTKFPVMRAYVLLQLFQLNNELDMLCVSKVYCYFWLIIRWYYDLIWNTIMKFYMRLTSKEYKRLAKPYTSFYTVCNSNFHISQEQHLTHKVISTYFFTISDYFWISNIFYKYILKPTSENWIFFIIYVFVFQTFVALMAHLTFVKIDNF